MAISRPFAYNPSLTPISGATQTGNLAIATSSTALSNTNGSVLFNSSPSQYLSIPNNVGFTQNQPFTIECWFYPTTLQGGYVWAMLQPNFLTVVYRNSGKFVIDMSYVGNPPGYTPQNRTYPINNWYHIALSWNGTNGWLFINGVVEWTFTGAGALVNSGNPLLIGQYQGQGQSTPLGNISNFRVVKGTAVYTGTFSTPTSPLTTISGTQLLLNTNNVTNFLIDSSTNSFTVTNNGSVTISSLSPFTNTTKWWNGPDESLGHVIAVPVATNTQPTPISGVSASVGFYRTNGLTDNGFIYLAQSVALRNGTPQVFSTTTDAKTWLNTNGFWTSYTPLLPVLYLDAGSTSSYPGTGTTWSDISGNGNHVTMQNSGSISWTGGIGYFTTGSNGWFSKTGGINIPTGSSLYTFSAWIQLGTTWNSQGIMSIGPFFQINQGNALRTGTTNQFLNYWWGNDLAAISSLSPTNSWFNVVARDNGTDRSIWVNGVSIATGSRANHNVTTSDIQIAKTYNTEYLNGNIAQVLIYNVALSDDQILTNFNTTKTRFGL